MKDWDTYSATKVRANELGGDKPSVKEYFAIKIIDNGLHVTIVGLTVLFAGLAVFLDYKKIAAATWFYDLAKLSFGVILGMFAEKRKK